MAGETYVKRWPAGFNDSGIGGGTYADSQYLNGVEAALLRLLGADPQDACPQIWDAVLGRFKTIPLTNAHIDAAAAIAKSKLAALNIADADVAAGAAIAKSKLNLSGQIVNADINAAAAIALSKLADPGSGKVLTSAGAGAVAAFPPGYELVYTELTSQITVSSTTESAGNSIFAPGAVTFDGSPVILEVFCPNFLSPAVAAGFTALCLFEGATELGKLAVIQSPAAAANSMTLFARRKFTPSAGSHTYTVTAFVSSGSGLVGGLAGGTAVYLPAYLRITKA